jgi:hypothetical protein
MDLARGNKMEIKVRIWRTQILVAMAGARQECVS